MGKKMKAAVMTDIMKTELEYAVRICTIMSRDVSAESRSRFPLYWGMSRPGKSYRLGVALPISRWVTKWHWNLEKHVGTVNSAERDGITCARK